MKKSALALVLGCSLMGCGSNSRHDSTYYSTIINGTSYELRFDCGVNFSATIRLVVIRPEGVRVDYQDNEPNLIPDIYCTSSNPNFKKNSSCLYFGDLDSRKDIRREYVRDLSMVLTDMSKTLSE